jgi:CheY-like chemotaxis protein
MEITKVIYIDDDHNAFLPLVDKIRQHINFTQELMPQNESGIVTYKIANFLVKCVKTSELALSLIEKEKFDIIFIDFKLSDEYGDEVGKKTYNYHQKKYKRLIYQVMLTAYDDKLIDTLRAGVFRDFIGKPLNDINSFTGVIERYNAYRLLEKENVEAKNEIKRGSTTIFVGKGKDHREKTRWHF